MGRLGDPPPDPSKPIPYCQMKEYADTSYCACLNSRAPYPICGFAPCTTSRYAYKTTVQRDTAKDAKDMCPPENICQNIASLGGRGNIVKTQQTINCGGTSNVIKTSATITTVIMFFLLVMLAVILATPAPPPPDRESLPPLPPLASL